MAVERRWIESRFGDTSAKFEVLFPVGWRGMRAAHTYGTMRSFSAVALAAMAAVACSTPRSGDAARSALETDGSAPMVESARNVVFYVAEPLSAVPGTAVRYEGDGGASGEPSFLEEACIRGAVARGDGADAGAAAANRFESESGQEENALLPKSPTVRVPGEATKRFVVDTQAATTRVVGSAFARVEGPTFSLRDPARIKSGPACGTHYVRAVTPSRFLHYAVTLDFPSLASASDFRALGGDANVVKSVDPALATLLKERGAKLTLRVLVSRGIASAVAEKLRGVTCGIDDLEGCVGANERLFELIRNIGTLPGSNDSLDALRGPGATWNVYSVGIAPGSTVR